MSIAAATIANADLHPSPEALIQTIKRYDFLADREGLRHLLSIEEPRQPEEAARFVIPKEIEEAQILWQSKESALAFVTSRPPTSSTPTETGALLLLGHSGTGWTIATKIPFSAVGKYANIRFEFTGGDYSPPPIVTVTTFNGGRGSSCRVSASYEVLGERLIRKDP